MLVTARRLLTVRWIQRRARAIMERLTVDDMKSIELEIMDEIDCVCHAHGVQYYLGYGSLWRHSPWWLYPWDDDMDIVMMRDQYELLMEHFNEWRTTERFKLVSYRDKSSIYQFAKNSGYYHGRLRDFCGEKGINRGMGGYLPPGTLQR